RLSSPASSAALPCFFFAVAAPPELCTLPYTTLFRSCSPPDSLVPWLAKRSFRFGNSSKIASTLMPPGLTCGGSIRFSSTLSEERSEEHTSELQSRENLVCRLLLEKKNRTRLHSRQL